MWYKGKTPKEFPVKSLVLALAILTLCAAPVRADDITNVTITAAGLTGGQATNGMVVTFGNYPGVWVLYTDTHPFQTAWALSPGAAMPVLNVVTPPVTSLAPGVYANGTLLVPTSISAVPNTPTGAIPVTLPGLAGVWNLYNQTVVPVAVNQTTGQTVYVTTSSVTPPGLYDDGTGTPTLVYAPGTVYAPFVPVPGATPNLWHPGDAAPAGNPGPATPSAPAAPEPARSDPSEHADLTNRGR